VKPLIFISHSCKDFEPALDVSDPEAAARQSRLDLARDVRTAIVERLRAEEFEPWLDVERLDPGAEWRAELYLRIGCCDGAVILLNQETLASPWARYEASILANRYWLSREPFKGPRIVCVMVGEEIHSDQLRRCGWGPISLRELQYVRPQCTPEEYAEEVVRAFKDLRQMTSDQAMNLWVKDVKDCLRDVSEERLREAATQLKIRPEDFVDDRRVDRLAYTLLNADQATALAVMDSVAPPIDPFHWGWLVDLVSPIWVRPEAAHALLEAATRHDPPVVAIERTDEQMVGLHYVRRATCCSSRYFPIKAPVPMGEWPVDKVVAAYDEQIVIEVGRHWQQARERLSAAGRTYYVLLCRDGLPDEQLRDVVRQLTAKYPGLLLILMPGPEAPADCEHPVVRIEPALEPVEVEEAKWYVDQVVKKAV
jgi:hypothetical protein